MPATDADVVCSYDDVPYPSLPFAQTHPDHVYSMARLFGLQPPLPDTASILELGCASGGNLIPLAVQLPAAQLTGIDLSPRQIAAGQRLAGELGLSNLRLAAADLQTVDSSWGQFDYILCHGVFSWVPPTVQRRILQICRERLTANGIAYVSYNCNPGWFMRGMIRQMMLHHVRHVSLAAEKVAQSRALLKFLVDATAEQQTPYGQFLRQELDMLSGQPDGYLFHEHLEDNNHPMFFHEFMDLVREAGLQFLSETNLTSEVTGHLPPAAAAALAQLTNDLYQRHQYADFIVNRTFRQSLLCQPQQRIQRHLNEHCLLEMRFAGSYKEVTGGSTSGDQPGLRQFECPGGHNMSTDDPIQIALITALNETYPASCPFAELPDRVVRQLNAGRPGDSQQTADSVLPSVNARLLRMLIQGTVDFRCLPDRFCGRVSDRPTVSALSRYQATTGVAVTDQRHRAVNVGGALRRLIPALDGTRDRAQIVQFVEQLSRDGRIAVQVQGAASLQPADIISAATDSLLEQLRRSALLVR